MRPGGILAVLNDAQRKLISDLVDLQRRDLEEIVKTRQVIAAELRRFLKGESADKARVLSLSKRYGELDGEISYFYATAFAAVGKTLTAQQKEKLADMRASSPSDPNRCDNRKITHRDHRNLTHLWFVPFGFVKLI